MIDAIKFRELVDALALASAEVVATKGAASVRWARACNERQRAVDELADLLVAHADALLALVEDGWQPIETAPRDGRYILAIGAENDAYHIGRHAGRPFCIRYEFDLGWGVYPGYGGAPDRQFTYWKPLDLPPPPETKP